MNAIIELPESATSTAMQHAKLSSKYHFLDTSIVTEIMNEQGFVVTQAHAVKPRVQDPRCVEHFLRLRHESHMDAVNGSIPEILLVNSHNGYTSLRMESALFRLICGNGLIVKSAEIYSSRIRHVDVTEELVIAEATKVIDSARLSAQRIELFMGKIIAPHDCFYFAQEAAEIARKIIGAQIDPSQLMEARREEDEGRQLWNLFNRVQENIVKGGVKGKTPSGRLKTTRGVNGALPLVQVNEKLWELAESYLER